MGLLQLAQQRAGGGGGALRGAHLAQPRGLCGAGRGGRLLFL